MIKGAKSIAEYAIRKWLQDENADMNRFSLTIEGNEGILEADNGEQMTLVYEEATKKVFIK